MAEAPNSPRHWETTGFQKFLGLEVTFDAAPNGPAQPFDNDEALLMDATGSQRDGFRFMYVLPFEPGRALVEETAFADEPDVDEQAARTRILAYLQRRGATGVRVIREERGVLPMPWAVEAAPPLGAPLRLGYQGGWFHPATGYSLPIAARVAKAIAGCSPEAAPAALLPLWQVHRRQSRFAQRLNRLLFRAIAPADRWAVFSRFYRLPPATIARFYALETTAADRARLLCGRPPRGLSMRAALFPAPQPVTSSRSALEVI
jgi:lycopene beta-cyclase